MSALYRRVRRWARRIRYRRVDRIPIKYKHPVDQLIFYADCCGFDPPTPEAERAMRAYCDQEVPPP